MAISLKTAVITCKKNVLDSSSVHREPYHEKFKLHADDGFGTSRQERPRRPLVEPSTWQWALDKGEASHDAASPHAARRSRRLE